MAPIAVGDKLPEGQLAYIGEKGVETLNVTEFAKGKKIVLFGVPGAFTPTCSLKHVPGFLDHGEEIKKKGVAAILCVSVNDPFVMDAWAKTYPNTDIIKFVADGSGVTNVEEGGGFEVSSAEEILKALN
ncbi:hypothetical protein R1sor_000512 [Riccia sorocarpa]|uniref:Glutaredoxin-dependent peroxiredoxin n=1 Tax=Riccia sorocarpa TaxID=122646 RepID=A0ABD3GWH0_9MARC